MSVYRVQMKPNQPLKHWHGLVIGHVGVCKPNTLNKVMADQDGTITRVSNQIKAWESKYPGLPLELDFEAGADGWSRPDVRKFVKSLLALSPNFYLFTGVSFFQFINENAAEAGILAEAAPRGILFPCYHGTINLNTHLAITKKHLNAMKFNSIKFTPMVWHFYHGVVGMPEGTKVPQQDFNAGCQLCKTYGPEIAVWA